MLIKCPCCSHTITINVVAELTQIETNPLSLGKITDTVLEYSSVTLAEVMSNSRRRPVVIARHKIFWLAKRFTRHTLKEIGEYIGNRDHSTVLHGIQTMRDLMDTDETILGEIAELCKLCDSFIQPVKENPLTVAA